MSIRAASVTRLGYRALAALITVVLVFGNVRLYASDPSTSDLVARLEFLRQELRGGSAERMQDLFPEGYAFSYALYGLTWTNLARTDDSLRERALDEARWALRKLESPAGKAVFDAALTPRYGVFHAGWSTLLRGRVVRLAGPDAPEAGRFAADVEELATAFRTDGPFLEAYPGQAWPVDSVVAIAAVRLHDSVSDEPRYDGLIHRWLRQVEQRLDPETGLLPHRVEPFESGARASSQALIQRFLPLIDPDRAGSRYERFRDRFVTSRASLPGVLEYPTGTDGAGDVDSGPLILGVSASATVVTIGAARANGDSRVAGELIGLGEAIGMPVTFGAGKRYAFGLLPIGDAFLAWAASVPMAEPPDADHATGIQGWWRLPWHGIGVVLLGLLWWPVVRAVSRTRRTRPTL